MIEQRGSKRYRKEIPVAFSEGGKNHKGMSSDFSSSGVFIITRQPCKPGTSIKMTLEISKKEKIYLTGIVVRTIKTGVMTIKDGMGIKLTDSPFTYQKFLDSLKAL